MADTNRKVNVEIDFTGTDKAAAGVKKVSDGMEGFSHSLANVSAEELKAAAQLERLERQTARLQTRLANNAGFQQSLMSLRRQRAAAAEASTAEDQFAAAARRASEAAAAQGEASTSAAQGLNTHGMAAAEAANRTGQMIGAVGNLATVAAASIPELNQYAGIIGGVGTAISAAASSMGPWGIALAAATVALPPLIALLREEEEATRDVEAANHDAAASFDDMVHSIQRANRERARAERVAMGLGTVEEQQAQLRVAQARLENLEEQRRQASILEATSRVGRVNARMVDNIAAAQQQQRSLGIAIDDQESRVAEAQRQLRIAQLEQSRDVGEGLAADQEARRRRGGGRRGEDPTIAMIRQAEREAEAAAMSLEFDLVRALGDEYDEQRETLGDMLELVRLRLSAEYEEAANAKERSDELARLEQEKEEEAFQRRARAKELADEEEAKREEEATRRRDAEMKKFSDAGEAAAGVLSSAFQLAITGQEDLGVALAQGFSDLMLQKGTEAVFDGTKALFEAVGYATTGNAAAAAGKAAEGAGLIALGASVGAVGAAIAPPAGGAAEQPRTEPDPADAGGGTLVVNYNSPLAIVGDERTVAQSISGIGRRSLGRQITPGRRAA